MQSRSKTSPARQAFLDYVRTGRCSLQDPFEDGRGVERKFNPYHDPDDGRFTFAPGGPRSLSHVVISRGVISRDKAPGSARSAAKAPASTRPTRRTDSLSGIALSRTHRAFLAEAKRFPAKPGTLDRWTGEGSKKAFKDQFIAGHSNAIRAAASRYDLPAPLVAAVAYRELGSDHIMNDVAYAARAESGRDIPRALGIGEPGRGIIDDLNRPRDETSFGPHNIQQRRAAEILGYGNINRMSETARRILIPTTREPVPATFMLAKHLSDLRDQDFPGVSGSKLTVSQMLVVATRYKAGPEQSLQSIKSPDTIKFGKDYLMAWPHVERLLKK